MKAKKTTGAQGRTEFLNSVEAAKFLGVKRSYLYHLTRKNEIPHYKPKGKIIYFLESDLREWVLNGKCKGGDICK